MVMMMMMEGMIGSCELSMELGMLGMMKGMIGGRGVIKHASDDDVVVEVIMEGGMIGGGRGKQLNVEVAMIVMMKGRIGG